MKLWLHLTLAIAAATCAAASTSTTYSIPSQAIASSGHSPTSETYNLRDVIAQPSAIGSSTSSTYAIYHGFMYSLGADFAEDATFSAGLGDLVDAKGIAWGDYNGDGSLDVFVARGATAQPDYLFHNRGNSTFSNVTSSAGISDSAVGVGTGWADADADGRIDLFVGNEGSPSAFWQNRGNSGFTNVADVAGLASATAGVASCWGDYDGDGLPDLVMASTNGSVPHLYHNKGGGIFERTDSTVGLTNSTYGSAFWGDYDNDGDLDLFVAQGGGHGNLLYENIGGTQFVEVAASKGITGASWAYGATWGDYNNDGWLDLYVINTGTNRDILYRNDTGTFVNVTATAGLTDNHDGRSAAWSDVDADGDLDLFVANCGTNGQADILYYNDGDGTFTALYTTSQKQSYGAAWGDFDGDGDQDLLVSRLNDHLALYRVNRPGDWLRVRPLDGNGNETCYGTQVRLFLAGTDTVVAMRQIDGGHGTGCQDAYTATFSFPPGNTNRYDIEVRYMTKGDPLGTGTNVPLVVDKLINPDLGNVSPDDVGSGFVDVRENGRVFVSHGAFFVVGGEVALLQNSGAIRPLSTEGGGDPAGSPDGSKVVFSSTRNGNGDIFVRLTSGGSDQPLLTNSWNETKPAWATDNSGIAYVSDQHTNLEIYLVDIAGEGVRNLTQNNAMDTDPAWSPNSVKIAFASDRDGGTNIFVMDYDGANPSNLTGDSSVNVEPAWSPDGLHIAFTSYRDTNAEIYVMNFDGSSPENIPLNSATDRHPTWNEDGSEILFESDRDGTPRIYACDPDGNNPRVLTPLSEGRSPSFPMAYKYPPKSVVFGMKNGRTTYWADPVNTEGGNFTVSENDFVLLGRGQPIQFTRFYNSQDPFDTPMGFGWRHSYMIKLVRELNGNVTLTWGDGHQDFYQPFGSNTFTKVFGVTPGTLQETPSGFTFTMPDQTVYEFTIAGRLISITDKNNNTVDLTYSADDLIQVALPNGWHLNFSYFSNRISRVSDHAGRAVGFGYNEAGDLVSFTNTMGKAWHYTYDANHRLVTKINPLGVVVVSNEYGSVGRVVKQWDANGALTTYEYELDVTNLEARTKMTDPLGRKVTHTYDAYRRLRSVTDNASNTVSFTYDSYGNRNQGTDRMGNTYHFDMSPVGLPTETAGPETSGAQITYDSNHNPLEYVDELNRLTKFAYDPVGNLVAVTNSLGASTRTYYNAYGQPTNMVDENGRSYSLAYDTNGQVTVITDTLGRQTTLGYDGLGRMVSRTDPETNTTTYAFSSNNLLTSVTDARGGQAFYEYDDADRLVETRTKVSVSEWLIASNMYDNVGRIIRHVDARGFSTSYGYDGYGNLMVVTNAQGGVARLSYDADNQVTQIVDEAGAIWSKEYDLNGRLLREVAPGTNEVRYAYDDLGRVVAATNALGFSRHFEYDDAGQLIRLTDERGYAVSRGFDQLGRVTAVTNQINGVRQYTYDNAGNIIRSTDENTNSTKYVYDDANNLVCVTNAAGIVTRFTYDRNNRLKTAADGKGNVTEYFYDKMGNRTQIKDPLGRSTYFEYDLAGRMTKATDYRGNFTSYLYDEAGNLIRTIDRLSHSSEWEYDELGRVTHTVNASGEDGYYHRDAIGRVTNVTDELGNTVNYLYDEAGRLALLVGPRTGEELRSYDRLGRMVEVQDPLGRIQQYDYDPVGNLTNFVAADSQAIRYSYDQAGRLMRSDYPDTTFASNTYDAAGNLLKITGSLGTISNRYDSLNRLMSRRDIYGKTVSYEYDTNSNVSAVIYPTGKRVEYQYDVLNRMTQVKDWLTNTTTYSYDELGNLAAVTNGNGTRVRYTYDDQQRLIGVRNEKSDGTVIAEQFFVLDALGNRVQETRNYPVLPVLEEGDTSYSYDIADQVQTAGVDVVEHDLKGNMVTKGSATYTFDYANHLTRAAGDGFDVNYTYDQQGNRIAKSGFAGQFVQQRFTVDANRKLASVLSENTIGNAEQAYYVYGLGLVSRITTNNLVRYYHYDALGSTIALSDGSQNVTDTFAYDPYGKVLNSLGTNNQPYRYAGQAGVADEAYGLLFMRARYYETVSGRFLAVDPLRDQLAMPSSGSSYVYARDNAISFGDPTGQVADWIVAGLVGSVVGVANQMTEDLMAPEQSSFGSYLAASFGGFVGGVAAYGAIVVGSPNYLDAFSLASSGTKNALMEYGSIVKEGRVLDWQAHVEALGNTVANTMTSYLLGKATPEVPVFGGSIMKGTIRGSYPGCNVGFDFSEGSDYVRCPVPIIGDKTIHPEIVDPTTETMKINYPIYSPEPTLTPRQDYNRGQRAANQYFSSYQQTDAQMNGAINSLTRGMGWESMSGQHGLNYSTANYTYSGKYGDYNYSYTYLSGYWYWNVSRCVELAVPAPTFSTWLDAHAAQRSAMRSHVAANYTANGRNTPWIPEIYEAFAIDGKFAVYGK